MGRVVRFPPSAALEPDHPVRRVPSLAGAVEAFFANRDLAAETRRTYRKAFTPLVEAAGGDRPVTDLDADQVAALFVDRWARCAPATWNTRRVAVEAFAVRCGDRWPLAGDPLAGVAPRRRRVDNTRAIPLADLEELWRRRGVPLREKALWRVLYETAARASEVLALDVEDLDRVRRRARIRSKGGSVDMVVWAAPTTRLLGRYLADRGGGPLFLTRWRSRTAPAARDLYEPMIVNTDGPGTVGLSNRRGGVPPALRPLDPPPDPTLVVDASGRGGSVRRDVAGKKPASGPAYLVGVYPARGRTAFRAREPRAVSPHITAPPTYCRAPDL